MIIHKLCFFNPFFLVFLSPKCSWRWRNQNTDLLQWFRQASSHKLALFFYLRSLGLKAFIEVAGVKVLQLAVNGALPRSGQVYAASSSSLWWMLLPRLHTPSSLTQLLRWARSTSTQWRGDEGMKEQSVTSTSERWISWLNQDRRRLQLVFMFSRSPAVAALHAIGCHPRHGSSSASWWWWWMPRV